MSNMQRSPTPHSHLFTVRLWQECISEEMVELRCEVRHVLSGELRYFRDWSTLITYLADKVHELAQEGGINGASTVPTIPAGGEVQSNDIAIRKTVNPTIRP